MALRVISQDPGNVNVQSNRLKVKFYIHGSNLRLSLLLHNYNDRKSEIYFVA